MNRLLLFFFLCSVNSSFSQQIPFYNHHFINPFIYNPAFTGYKENVSAFLVRNSRNSSFDGGVINNYLTVDGGLKEGKHGLGLSAAYQTQGIQQQLGAGLSYSYLIKINNNHSFRAGVQMGFLDNQLDAAAINVEMTDDPFLQELSRNKLTYNATFGLLYTWKTMRIGFSIPQLIGNKVKYGKVDPRGFYQLERHYMLNISQPITLTKDKVWSLTPNVMLRYLPGLNLQYDVLLKADHKKWAWLAVGYKSDYAVELNAGIKVLDGLKIGYSYEYVIGSLAAYKSGMNHEIMLGYTFKNDKYKDRIAELEKQKDQLNQANDHLEQVITNSEAQLIERNLLLEDSLTRLNFLYNVVSVENRKLLEEVEAYRKTLDLIEAEDSLDMTFTPETDVIPEDEKIIRSAGYNFVDLQNIGAISGYYVINGVFSSRSNAINHLESTKNEGHPDAYLLLNKTNHFYYVIVFYSTDDVAAVNARKEYSKTTSSKIWVLEYFQMD